MLAPRMGVRHLRPKHLSLQIGIGQPMYLVRCNADAHNQFRIQPELAHGQPELAQVFALVVHLLALIHAAFPVRAVFGLVVHAATVHTLAWILVALRPWLLGKQDRSKKQNRCGAHA